MYKKILASVDGSTTSKVALLQAIRLAKHETARLRLLHVTDYAGPDFDEYDYAFTEHAGDSLHEAGEAILREAQAAAREGIDRLERDMSRWYM